MSILKVFKKEKEAKDTASKMMVAKPKKADAPAKKVAATIKTGKAWNILARPIVTEKATRIQSASQYVFEVARYTNKVEVAQAVFEVYGVRPMSVNMVNVAGKFRRFGRSSGKTKDVKKAIVTLKKGDTIQIYEGV